MCLSTASGHWSGLRCWVPICIIILNQTISRNTVIAAQHLHLPFVAPSLGGVESLVCLPAETSHLALGPEGRKVCLLCELIAHAEHLSHACNVLTQSRMPPCVLK